MASMPASSASHQRIGLVQFIIEQYGIQCHEDSCPEFVGIPAEGSKVIHAVACRLPGTECRPCNIDGIGTAVYCRDADFYILCRSQKFQISHVVII